MSKRYIHLQYNIMLWFPIKVKYPAVSFGGLLHPKFYTFIIIIFFSCVQINSYPYQYHDDPVGLD